jgi:hypothetical protein
MCEKVLTGISSDCSTVCLSGERETVREEEGEVRRGEEKRGQERESRGTCSKRTGKE